MYVYIVFLLRSLTNSNVYVYSNLLLIIIVYILYYYTLQYSLFSLHEQFFLRFLGHDFAQVEMHALSERVIFPLVCPYFLFKH